MNEHIDKILNDKLVYGIHVAVYAIFTLLNMETLLDSEVRELGYPLPAAIVFTALFVLMFLLETVSYRAENSFLKRSPAGFVYRVIQILIIMVYYFLVPVQIGSGACLVAMILFHVELVFYISFEERHNRIFMYVIFGVVFEAFSLWQVVTGSSVYRGINFIVNANVVILSIVILCELMIRTYSHFIRLLFAQNRTVENLNEANGQLKDKQEEIKRVNERLGMQKVKLQAANKKINRSHDEMSVQNELASAITSIRSMEELLQKICRIMRIRLDMDVVGVLLHPDASLEVPGEAVAGRKLYLSTTFDETHQKRMEEAVLSGSLDELFELTQTYIQNMDRGNSLNHGMPEEQILESLLILPLTGQEERAGSLIVGNTSINVFMDNRAFYENIAAQISIGIANMRLYEKMKQMAERDGLTRIYNRGYLTKLLNEYLTEAIQKKLDVTLALFDIDKFKLVNDTYGHPGGDAVIRHVAALLNAAAVSGGGIAGRYGGEEFVMMFKGKSLGEVHEIVKNVHARIREEEVVFEENVIHVRVSAGISSYPETCQNPADLLTRADWAMYHSKRTGRDRITVDSDELETTM